jgi:hypothetical protein
MRIPAEAVIPREKLSRYLLVHREWDDKSQFLARVGFTNDRPTELDSAIRRVAAENDAVDDGTNEYGTFFRVAGELVGPTGGTLPVILIWLQWKLDGTFHFVTLKPIK